MRVLESDPNTLVFHGNHFVEVNENETTGENDNYFNNGHADDVLT